MIVSTNKRVAQIAGVSSLLTANRFSVASASGPRGSTLMTFFAIYTMKRAPSATELIWACTTGGSDGWYVYHQTGFGLRCNVVNSTPGNVTAPAVAVTASLINVPLIHVGVYNNGTLTHWINAVSGGSQTTGSGFTNNAAATTVVGNFGAGTGFPAPSFVVHECGLLNSYNMTSSVSATTQQWQEDLQQDRYLTWPRAAVLGSDWYWSARDVIAGVGQTLPTWTDRYSAIAMTRAGTPQSAAVPARF